METPFPFLLLLVLAITATGVCATESPGYKLIHSEPDFEIRLYTELSWMTASVHGASFENSTKDGFHRLYEYIHGSNLDSANLSMTAPVLTTITQSPRGYGYAVRYYISSEHEKSPPKPSTELNLQLDKWKTHCIAVRKFSGFAKDDNIEKEKDALLSSLGKNSIKDIAPKITYAIAQYNASFHLSQRVNEVWIDVSGFNAEGCPI